MKKGFRSKECKSCSANKQSCYVPHYYTIGSETSQCPCKKCLIKVMCSEACHNFDHYCKCYFNLLKNNPLEYYKHIASNTERSIASNTNYEIRKIRMGRDCVVLSEINLHKYKRGGDEYRKKNNY